MLQFINFVFPEVPQVRCAFQMRSTFDENNPYSGGNLSFEVGDVRENVVQNRAKICEALDVDAFTDVMQVHGIETVFNPPQASAEAFADFRADGLASDKTSHALCIKTADCQPILITEKQGKHILALHSGWRGNRQEYPQIAVKDFCEHYNLKAENLFAVRGPSLSPYMAEFINYDTEWGNEFDTWFDKRHKTVDLWQLTKDQLNAVGIPYSHIYSIDLCTYTNIQMFFSYRRIQKSGRQGSFIWIKK